MIKDIVVNLGLGARDPAGDFAISVADTFKSYVLGVAFAYEPIIPGSVMGGIPAEFIETQRAESDKKARAAVTRFDLIVIGQPERERAVPEEVVNEGALFESGRPVIFVPFIQKAGLKLDRVMVCWDGSRAAARAIADAMPFLHKAKQVEIVMVSGAKPKDDEIAGVDLGQHLARHGLKVDVKRITSPEIDVASTILSYAAVSSADLIVMGGYGHSRLREFILGGVTRGLFESMTVPALMSH